MGAEHEVTTTGIPDGLLTSRLFLRSSEVVQVLGLSPATVRRMIASGDLPSVIINRGSRRIPVVALVDWARSLSEDGR